MNKELEVLDGMCASRKKKLEGTEWCAAMADL